MLGNICRIGLLIASVFLTSLNPSSATADEEVSSLADSSDARTYFIKGTVVTANRYEQRPFDVSQPITLFSGEDIRGLSPAIVPDLFRNVPGVEINDAGPFRTRPVIRGVFGNRVLVLVDGERLNNSRQSSPAGAQLSLVDIGQVERVETLYGPGAVLYGSDALGGVINIITKSPSTESAPESFKPHGSAEVRYSTVDEQKKGRLEFGGEYKRLSVLAGGSMREASDYESAEGPVVNSGLGEENNLDLKLKYGLTDEYDLSADFQRFRAKDIGYPGTPDPPNFPPRFFFPYHDRDKLVISCEGNNLSPRLANLKGKLYYQKISKDFETELTMPIGPTMSLYSFSQTLTDVETYGFSFQELFVTAKNQHLTWGVDYYREVVDGSREQRSKMQMHGGPVMSDDTSTISTVPQNHQDALGLFLSNQLNFLEAAILTLGVRYDYFRTETKKTSDYLDTRLGPPQPFESETQSLSSFNGSLGLVYKLTSQVNLVANAASGYRAPNVVERYFIGQPHGVEFVVPNYDLEAEKSFNLDAGVKAGFEKLYASLNLFHNSFRDFIGLEWTGDSVRMGPESYPEYKYTNITELRISGVEGTLEGDPGKGFHGSLSFAYQYGKNITRSRPFFVAPLKTAVSLEWRSPEERFGIGSSLRWVDEQDRIPTNPEGRPIDNLPTPSFTVVNLNAFVSLFDWQTLNLSVNNVFDESYAEPYNATNSSNPVKEPGRNFVVSFIIRYQ